MIKYFILILLLSIPSLTNASEIKLINCQKSKTVIAKVESIETGGHNEYLTMVGKRSNSRATLIRTYNPKYENSSVVTDIDNGFHYYTYAECTFKLKNKIHDGLFFIDKREIMDKEIKKIVGVVDIPGNMGGSISNKGVTVLYEDSKISEEINRICGIGNECEIEYMTNSHDYIEKIIKIRKIHH